MYQYVTVFGTDVGAARGGIPLGLTYIFKLAHKQNAASPLRRHSGRNNT